MLTSSVFRVSLTFVTALKIRSQRNTVHTKNVKSYSSAQKKVYNHSLRVCINLNRLIEIAFKCKHTVQIQETINRYVHISLILDGRNFIFRYDDGLRRQP